jgi:hypothetical protein
MACTHSVGRSCRAIGSGIVVVWFARGFIAGYLGTLRATLVLEPSIFVEGVWLGGQRRCSLSAGGVAICERSRDRLPFWTSLIGNIFHSAGCPKRRLNSAQTFSWFDDKHKTHLYSRKNVGQVDHRNANRPTSLCKDSFSFSFTFWWAEPSRKL